jgi:hypothetical protein
MIGAPRQGFQRPRLLFTRSRTHFAVAEQRCLRDLCAVLLCAAMLLRLTWRNDCEAPLPWYRTVYRLLTKGRSRRAASLEVVDVVTSTSPRAHSATGVVVRRMYMFK